jgi:ABC-2 type transport system ATP-binding protein
MIEVEDLTKYYGKFKALDGVNLKIDENEVFGFLGPNGAGKTTTINLILGLLNPDRGRIRVAGIDVQKNPLEVKRICGYLPENAGFYSHMTARQNLMYFSEFYRMSKDQMMRRIQECLELVGLDYAADKKVGEFSRGMKQRLGLAQALINDPEIIFLDEPTAGLDPNGSAEFIKIIMELKKEGKTIFFSSHILSEVKKVCETVGIIHRGRIVAKGTIKDLSSGYRIAVAAEPEPDQKILKKYGRVKYDYERGIYLLETDRDCRIEVSRELFEHGFVVKELHLMEPSLEEIYFSLVEGGESD